MSRNHLPKSAETDHLDVSLVVKRLRRQHPHATCKLNYSDAFELLIAAMLLPYCNERQVNKVTEKLFSEYPDARTLAAAECSTLEKHIYSLPAFRRKARRLLVVSKAIADKFDNLVPRDVSILEQLPGVSRRTASFVIAEAYGNKTLIIVDDRVMRVAFRLGISRSQHVMQTERDIQLLIDNASQEADPITLAHFSRLLSQHGMTCCHFSKPLCRHCYLSDICRYTDKNLK